MRLSLWQGANGSHCEAVCFTVLNTPPPGGLCTPLPHPISSVSGSGTGSLSKLRVGSTPPARQKVACTNINRQSTANKTAGDNANAAVNFSFQNLPGDCALGQGCGLAASVHRLPERLMAEVLRA